MAKYRLNQEEYHVLFKLADLAADKKEWRMLFYDPDTKLFSCSNMTTEEEWHKYIFDLIESDKEIWDHINGKDEAITVYMILMGIMNDNPEWNQKVGKVADFVQLYIDAQIKGGDR